MLLPLLTSLLGACAGAEPAPPDAPPALASPAPLPDPSPAASPEKPMITNIQAGLAEAHRGQRPLLDRVESLGHGSVRGTRTYEDGTQYLLVSDARNPGAAEPAWSRFVTVTPQGVELLRKVIRESLVPYQAPPPAAGPSGGGGTITWVAYIDGQERVVQTARGNYDALPPFVRQLDEAVSQNVQRAE